MSGEDYTKLYKGIESLAQVGRNGIGYVGMTNYRQRQEEAVERLNTEEKRILNLLSTLST